MLVSVDIFMTLIWDYVTNVSLIVIFVMILHYHSHVHI